MKKNEKLIQITKKTINVIGTQEIVLPSLYKKVFCEHAKECNLKLEDIVEKDYEYNLEKIISQTEVLEKTTDSLSDNLEKASIAIKNKDEKNILLIQKELEKLRDELEKVNQELYTDELTEIFNRKWLFKKFLDKNTNFRTDGILAFIDLNEFKQINDRHGHIVGDKVLKLFSQHISKIQNAVAVRLAGDEFLIFFNYLDVELVKKELDAVNNFFAKKSFKFKESELFKIHFSYGYSKYEKGNHFNKTLDEADKEMYEHKNSKKVKN